MNREEVEKIVENGLNTLTGIWGFEHAVVLFGGAFIFGLNTLTGIWGFEQLNVGMIKNLVNGS